MLAFHLVCIYTFSLAYLSNYRILKSMNILTNTLQMLERDSTRLSTLHNRASDLCAAGVISQDDCSNVLLGKNAFALLKMRVLAKVEEVKATKQAKALALKARTQGMGRTETLSKAMAKALVALFGQHGGSVTVHISQPQMVAAYHELARLGIVSVQATGGGAFHVTKVSSFSECI